MASYPQGYDEARFAITVNRNFLCLICFNVLKEPVMCSRNQHCFCRACITKHLQNSQRCPTCADELTVETLAEPQRMVKDYLNELPIHCIHINRGCQEIVQLQNLDRHEATCGFTPAVCSNQGCGATVNKRDLIHHESEQCEFRKLKCHSCGEMAKTLANVEKRVAHLETNMVTMETKMGNLEKNMEGKLEVVNNDVRGLKTALIASLPYEVNYMATVRWGDNIVVIGGVDKDGNMLDTVIMYNVKTEQSHMLPPMKCKRRRCAAVVIQNNIVVLGGRDEQERVLKSVEAFNFESYHWEELPEMSQERWLHTAVAV